MGRAAVDVAPDKICVPLFEIVRRTARPREDAVAKARRESFDLLLDPFAHIDARAERHVTISPEGMLTSRRARCVEEALLRYENEGRSGCRPCATILSPAAISSSVPPRCTVPARRHASAAQGIGAESA